MNVAAAHPPDAADDPPGDPDLLAGLLLEGGDDVGGQVRAIEAGRVRVDAGRAEPVQLLEALLEEAVVGRLCLAVRRPGVVICHSIAPQGTAHGAHVNDVMRVSGSVPVGLRSTVADV